jgi:hypothetical protein
MIFFWGCRDFLYPKFFLKKIWLFGKVFVHLHINSFKQQTIMQQHTLKQLESSVYKSSYSGWTAKTSFSVKGGIYDGRLLDVNTYKRGGNLVSTVSISEVEPLDNGFISKKFVIFQSPYKMIISTPVTRLTSKVVEEQHDKALARVFEFKTLAEIG